MRIRNKHLPENTVLSIVNEETGETYPYQPIIRKKRHDYFLAYYENLAKHNLMFALIGEMDYENKVIIDKRLKGVLSKRYSTTDGVIRNTLSKMVKDGFALRLANGVYFINPNLFTKASKNTISSIREEYGQRLSEAVTRKMAA
jgi:hypothetical protein